MLAEGMTKAAVARVVGVSPSTVYRWASRASEHVRSFHEHAERPREAVEVQLDELSCRGAGKARRAWVFSGIEVASRLWLGLRVGNRTLRNTRLFVREVHEALGSAARAITVTSDAFRYYEPAMRKVFEWEPVSYVQVHNTYKDGRIVRTSARRVFGSDFVHEAAVARNEDSKRPNTSFIERLNLRKRMCCSLLRRRNPAPARNPERVQEVLELVRVVYNFVRPHSSLRTRRGLETPAMAAGITQRPLTIREVLGWVVPGRPERRQLAVTAMGAR